jgi:hypothetical protein
MQVRRRTNLYSYFPMKTRTASLPLTLPVQEDSQVGLPKKRIRGRAGMVLLAA